MNPGKTKYGLIHDFPQKALSESLFLTLHSTWERLNHWGVCSGVFSRSGSSLSFYVRHDVKKDIYLFKFSFP